MIWWAGAVTHGVLLFEHARLSTPATTLLVVSSGVWICAGVGLLVFGVMRRGAPPTSKFPGFPAGKIPLGSEANK